MINICKDCCTCAHNIVCKYSDEFNEKLKGIREYLEKNKNSGIDSMLSISVSCINYKENIATPRTNKFPISSKTSTLTPEEIPQNYPEEGLMWCKYE